MRRLCLITVTCVVVCAAPTAAQAAFPGIPYATSSTGYLAVVTESYLEQPATLRVVTPDGAVGASEMIDVQARSLAVAVGPRGDALVVWGDDAGLWTRYRPPAGTLEPKVRIGAVASLGENVAALDIDAAGVAVVAWAADEDGRLRVRSRDATGSWQPEQTLGDRGAFRPALALADNGRAVLTWRQHAGRQPNGTRIAVSTREAGAPFGRAIVVAGIQRNPAEPITAMNERGDAVVAWIETHRRRRGDTAFSIHGVFRAATGPFSRPVRLSRMEAAGPQAAVLPSGRMVLAWTDNVERRAEARVRTVTGRLQPPRRITDDLEENTDVTVLAAGRGAVAWRDRDPGVSAISG
ncbi:MAG: hypothetical protein ACEQSX_21135, partial [Baekduiaceae bacterium]